MIDTRYQPQGREYFGTSTGRWIRPLAPDPDAIDIEDIAHHLGNSCRFVGGTRRFYSVAQHSVLVSIAVGQEWISLNDPNELALWALLHDAPETYLSDLASPVKYETMLGSLYQVAEERLMKVIAEKFGLSWPMPEAVREADDWLLYAEIRDLMPYDPPPGVEMYGLRIVPAPPDEAKRMFLRRFEELAGP